MIGIARLVTLLSSMFAADTARPAENFDIALKSGRIVDGTGSPWYVADVGIRGGKIVCIGRIEAETADRAIDVSGLVVAPGFVDMMGQTATPMLEDPKSALNLLTQGITTVNAGEGGSAAPLAQPVRYHSPASSSQRALSRSRVIAPETSGDGSSARARFNWSKTSAHGIGQVFIGRLIAPSSTSSRISCRNSMSPGRASGSACADKANSAANNIVI